MIILIACYLLAWASCRAALRGNSKFVMLNLVCLLVSAGAVGMVILHEAAKSKPPYANILLLSFLIVATYRDITDEESEKIFLCMLTNATLSTLILLQLFF